MSNPQPSTPLVEGPLPGSPLVEVRGLTRHFSRRSGMWEDKAAVVRAVEDVSFAIHPGETVGLVGESGSGKSTTGRLLLRLLEPTAGEIYFAGQPLHSLSRSALRPLRREMQIVFQDPYGAFNPRLTVAGILGEALALRGLRRRAERDPAIAELLELVRLPTNIHGRYPHEFSGGQRQRLGIARALAVQPRFLVADEPLSALDVSTQAEIVNLLLGLQQQLQLTMLFISHDLSVVRVLCDRVLVMFAGRVLEAASARDIFERPLQPYTRELLAAIPVPDPARARRAAPAEKPAAAEEAAPATAAAPQGEGCPYAGRCPFTMDICWREMPPLVDYAPRLPASSGPHLAACHWVEQELGQGVPTGH